MVRTALAGLNDAIFVEAGSGLEAIETLATTSVHALVLDLNMPDMHGLDVLGFLRSHDQYRALPVLILTTRSDDGSRSAALSAGASAYLTKPFAPSALVSAVRDLLQPSVPLRGSQV